VSRYVAVPVDLRQDWPKALRDAGFDTTRPTAWAAEGLLPYLPAAGQDLLFERIDELSAAGSRVAVESFGKGFFDKDYLASRREQIRRLREEAGEDPDANAPDTEDLWYLEDRTDVADWLTGHGWQVSAIEARELMTRYNRCGPDQDEATIPRSVFIEGHRIC
jgi:methyltransferase (TIGR00027 family)